MDKYNFTPPDIDKPGLADVHCHILPGVDDGARTPEESLKLIGMSYEQGFRTFVATSHCLRRRPNPDIEMLTAELRTLVHEKYPDVDIYPGHETFWHEALTDKIKSGEARRLAGSSYMLCEFDISSEFTEIVRGLRTIADMGLTPVLAHFERYASLREKDRPYELKRMGVIMQMNYEALNGGIFDSDARWCRRQVEEGITDILGTDMHRVDMRPPETMDAQKWLKKKLSPGHFDIITRRNALHIIRNEAVE